MDSRDYTIDSTNTDNSNSTVNWVLYLGGWMTSVNMGRQWCVQASRTTAVNDDAELRALQARP